MEQTFIKFSELRWVFHIHTEMPILAFSSLLCENKKFQRQNVPYPLVGIEPRFCRSYRIHLGEMLWKVTSLKTRTI